MDESFAAQLMQFETAPRRIVCLTDETTEVLYRLGEGERIVGVSGFATRPKEARRGKGDMTTSREIS